MPLSIRQGVQSLTGATTRTLEDAFLPSGHSFSTTIIFGLLAAIGFSSTGLANPSDSPPSSSAVRAEITDRLKTLGTASTVDALASGSTGSSPAAGKSPHADHPAPLGGDASHGKALQDLLHDRLRWLDEFDKATKTLDDIHQGPAIEARIATAVTELGQLNETLARARQTPEALLPATFQKSGSKVSEAMRQALEAKHMEFKAVAAKLETLRSEAANWETVQANLQAERDKLFHKVATTKAKMADPDALDAGDRSAVSRQLAQERLTNLDWEARVEALQLQAVETQISLAPKLASARDQELRVCLAHAEIATRTITLMQDLYKKTAELEEEELEQKADQEKSLARRSSDPLVRFRARRDAELFELEAQVIAHEQNLATNPAPCLEEQKALADHAVTDSERIKHLLDDGRVSRLDAIRLNNDFRRIGPERDRLFRNEMATVEARLQFYESLLTNVELELLQDSLHDGLENDLQKDRLDPAMQAKAEQLAAEYEQKHRNLLIRRRDALERLSENASQTLDQVTRRLEILDDEYGFIRTHIFWVRDREPIGLGTITLLGKELPYLATGLLRLARESAKPALWGTPSAEFFATSLLVIILPFGVVRLRSGLRSYIERDLPGECSRGVAPVYSEPQAGAPA